MNPNPLSVFRLIVPVIDAIRGNFSIPFFKPGADEYHTLSMRRSGSHGGNQACAVWSVILDNDGVIAMPFAKGLLVHAHVRAPRPYGQAACHRATKDTPRFIPRDAGNTARAGHGAALLPHAMRRAADAWDVRVKSVPACLLAQARATGIRA
jgi:hypothetical protein